MVCWIFFKYGDVVEKRQKVIQGWMKCPQGECKSLTYLVHQKEDRAVTWLGGNCESVNTLTMWKHRVLNLNRQRKG